VYSPDGTHIAFTSGNGNSTDVWIANGDGSMPTQLTHIGSSPAGCGFPSFSPDGSSIAFSLGTPIGNFLEFISSTGANRVAIGTSGPLEPSWTSAPQFSTLTGITVTVTGTSKADHISVVDDSDNGNLNITLNGKTESYNAALVQFVDIYSGSGNDTVDASTAPENIYANGGAGNDKLLGGVSNDTLTGGAGKNTLYGGDGDDRLNGSGGHDYLYGENGNDFLYGNGGDDYMVGGAGNDHMWGGDGDDQLYGNSGNDKMYGEGGNDIVVGGVGNDLMSGGPGADTINGQGGTDTAISIDLTDMISGVEITS
jgi:Ca2+-binding RTX toxin-like protein